MEEYVLDVCVRKSGKVDRTNDTGVVTPTVTVSEERSDVADLNAKDVVFLQLVLLLNFQKA